MNQYDLYLRLDDPEGSEKALFALNFYKAAFGLWLVLALVIGVAVVLSTYLSGVISFLGVVVLVLLGLNVDFIGKVARGENEGGSGPAESTLRIFRRELTGPSLKDSTSTTDKLVERSDDVSRVGYRLVLLVIPDIERYSLTNNVAEGFRIAWSQMGMILLLLMAYLLPWFILSFYLIHWREIASAT
jgi:hypothetical protein